MRCFTFQTPFELAQHLNVYREVPSHTSCPEIDPVGEAHPCNLFFLHEQNLFGVKRVPGIAYNMYAPSLQP